MIQIKDEQAAKEINSALTEAFDSIGRTLRIARDSCGEAESKAYIEQAGDLMYAIIFKLLEPLYFQHPAIRPEGWDNRPAMDPNR